MRMHPHPQCINLPENLGEWELEALLLVTVLAINYLDIADAAQT